MVKLHLVATSRLTSNRSKSSRQRTTSTLRRSSPIRPPLSQISYNSRWSIPKSNITSAPLTRTVLER